MLLESLIPYLPSRGLETSVYIIGMLGTILLCYSIFIEAEDRSDLMRAIGATAVGVYTLYIQNILLTITMAGILIASLVEFIQIYIGLHKHTDQDIREYKKNHH